MLGLLPEPADGYFIDQPDADILTASEKANIGMVRTQMMQAYEGGKQSMMGRMDFHTRIMGFSTEEAETIIANADKEAEERKQKQLEEQQAMLASGMMPPGMMGVGGVPVAEEGAEEDADPDAEVPGTQADITVPAANRLTRNNCGTGAGGFKEGNTCGTGGGKSGAGLWKRTLADVESSAGLPDPVENTSDIADALRQAVIDVAGTPKDMCNSAAVALATVYPEAEVYFGYYRGEAHAIAKLGGNYIDVTADQFGDEADVSVMDELPAHYRGYQREMRKADDLAGWPHAAEIVEKFRENVEYEGKRIAGFEHGEAVKAAVRAGKPVPAKVLKDYPEYAQLAANAAVADTLHPDVSPAGHVGILDRLKDAMGLRLPSAFHLRTLNEGGNCGTGKGGFKAGNTCAVGGAKITKASRSEMTSARRTGAGKDAKVVLENGTPAPSHITPAMVGHDWTDVKVATDPSADVLVVGRDKNGRAKTVYSDSFHMRQAAAKFARTQEGLQLEREMYSENQRNRQTPKLREHADCVWLMQEQATRPGSEADNKGTSRLFGVMLTNENVVVEGDKVSLKIGDDTIPIKDKKTKAELLRRLEASESLYDSTYWLKSHGATTLEGRHVVPDMDGGVRLQFVGKESVWHDHKIRNSGLAAMLLERKRASGERGQLFGTNYDTVTAYAKTLDGGKFTPKDFRTQKATALAAETVARIPVPANEKDRKAAIKHVGEIVSGVLGNDWQMAVASYIDPSVFTVWEVKQNG